jgi:hypothetical protein
VKNLSGSLRPLAALALVALFAAGCSSGSSTGTGSSASNNTNATSQSKSVRLAECMRDNGVTDFPDANTSSDQEFVDGIERARDRSPAAWKQAMSACKDLRPPGLLGAKATPKEMSDRLKFAQCIRDNGVKDFPDPTRDGPLVDTNRIPSSATSGGMTILNAAMHKCRDAAERAMGER